MATPAKPPAKPLTQQQINRRQRKADKQARKKAKKNQPTAPVDPNAPAPGPKLNPEMGNYNPNEWNDNLRKIYEDVMDPTRQDPTQDPNFLKVADQIREAGKRDFLGLNAAYTGNANAGGRFGSGMWQAAGASAQRNTEGNVYDAVERMFAGQVNANRDRVAGMFNPVAGYQVGQGNVNVGYENADANAAQARASMVGARAQGAQARASMVGANASMLGAQASMRNAGTNAAQFNFNRRMSEAAAQQDALNDYYNILAGIGGWGGTQTGQGGGQYIPTQNPWTAAAMGGLGGYMGAGGQFGANNTNAWTGQSNPNGNITVDWGNTYEYTGY